MTLVIVLEQIRVRIRLRVEKRDEQRTDVLAFPSHVKRQRKRVGERGNEPERTAGRPARVASILARPLLISS